MLLLGSAERGPSRLHISVKFCIIHPSRDIFAECLFTVANEAFLFHFVLVSWL